MWTDEKIDAEIRDVTHTSGMVSTLDAKGLLEKMRNDHDKVMRDIREQLRGIREDIVDVECWGTTVVVGEGN